MGVLWAEWTKLRTDSAGVSNPQPTGHTWPRMAMNVAQHKLVNLLKTLRFFHFCVCVFNVWPRDAKRLDPLIRVWLSVHVVSLSVRRGHLSLPHCMQKSGAKCF